MNVTLPPTATLHRILTRSCRAPSVHNSQPWRWRVDGVHLTLLADRARQLMRTDPDGRDLVLSCGAALHHLRVAAAGEGYRARVVRNPYGAGDNVLATVELLPGEPTQEAVAAAEVIDRRRTDRRSFSSWPLPEERLTDLVGAAEAQGVRAVAVTDPRLRRRLVEIMVRAAREPPLSTRLWRGPALAPRTANPRRMCSGARTPNGAPTRSGPATPAAHSSTRRRTPPVRATTRAA